MANNYKKFEELLEGSGKTIFKVAKETGLNPSMFYEWRKGLYNPKADKLCKIAEYFGVTLDHFYK